MSHLACADEPDQPGERRATRGFEGGAAPVARSPGQPRELLRHLPRSPPTISTSAAPGAAIYGVAPERRRPRTRCCPVVRLQAKVIQARRVEAGRRCGYGFSLARREPVAPRNRLVGYADGCLRSHSGRGAAWFEGVELPMVGKVSMDTITLDASALPEGALRPGTLIDLIDARHGVDAVAANAGTIGYEVLTSLGRRYQRHYVGGTAA